MVLSTGRKWVESPTLNIIWKSKYKLHRCQNVRTRPVTGHWSACACAGAGGGPSCAPRQRAGPPARRGSRGLHSPGEGLLFSYDQFSGSSPLGFIAIFFTKKLQLVSPARQRAPAPVISAPAVSRDLCHDSAVPRPATLLVTLPTLYN